MLSGPFCNNLVGILCLQSAFMSTNKQTWGRTSTEKRCSSCPSTLARSGRRQPCSKQCKPASTVHSSKRWSSPSSDRAMEARWCQVKHLWKGFVASREVLEVWTWSPALTALDVLFPSGMATSFEYHLCLCKMSCCRNHLGVRWKNVGKGYCSGDSGQEYALRSMPLTTLWSSAESCFHAAVQGWAATPAHFMAHIAPQVHMHALCDEGDKTLEQVAQRGGGCPPNSGIFRVRLDGLWSNLS